MENTARAEWAEPEYYEIIDGREVLMARPRPRHDCVSVNLIAIFGNFLRGCVCRVHNKVEVHFNDEQVFIPNICVVCDTSKRKRNGIYGAPDLVVEILSPKTAKYDLGRKKEIYEKHGVKEYWIINTEDRSVTIYALKDGKFDLRDIFHYSDAEDLKYMSEEERAEANPVFSPYIFEDMKISIADVFEGIETAESE